MAPPPAIPHSSVSIYTCKEDSISLKKIGKKIAFSLKKIVKMIAFSFRRLWETNT
jgi:hypothetical protein